MRVLVTSAGSSTGFGIIKSLRRAYGGQLNIVATDTNPEHLIAASTIADEFVRVEPAGSENYLGQLKSIVDDHQTSVLFPVHNAEVELMAQCASQLPNVRIVAPPLETVRWCNDKLAGFAQLRLFKIPTPDTRLAHAALDVGDGLFLKPRYGVGSTGAQLCRTNEEMVQLLGMQDEEYIAQEICGEPELTIDAFIGGKQSYCIVRERLEVKAGVCTKARIYQDEAIAELIGEMATAMGLSGIFCVQAMLGADRRLVFTDINPRVGGGTAMSLPLGVNFPAAMLSELEGDDPASYLPRLSEEAVVVRQYEEFLMS